MTDEHELEVDVGSRNESDVQQIEGILSGVNASRWGTSRLLDPVTILAISAGVVKLVDALVTLRKHLLENASAPEVTIRTADGTSFSLAHATPEEVRQLVEASAARTTQSPP
jgi:hypothetical protein